MDFLFTGSGLVILIIVAGVLGGTINHFLMLRNKELMHVPWYQNAIIGVGASLLVPLFLKTMSSNLVNDILDHTETNSSLVNTLVFFGFCLLGAIISRAFIKTLSDKDWRRLKNTVEEAKIDSKRALTEVGLLVEKESENGVIGLNASMSVEFEIDETERKVLHALITNREYMFRSIDGIRADSNLENEAIEKSLISLKEKGLVLDVTTAKGERWSSTSEGRTLVIETIAT